MTAALVGLFMAPAVGAAPATRPAAVAAPTAPLPSPAAALTPTPPGLPEIAAQAARRIVKLYGAGIGGEHGYASGVIVSPDGRVVTVLGLFLETTNLRAVTPDGHVYHAEVTYRDEYRQLALLKLARHPDNVDTEAPVDQQLAAMDLEAFVPAGSSDLRPGDWVLSVGNNFKVAEGDEPVSVLKGIVSGRTRIDAARGVQTFPFRGEVLVLDAITSTPGGPGSALIDLNGRWVGLVGKIVSARQTNTFLNYAYPIEEVQAFLRDAESGAQSATRPVSLDAPAGFHGIRLSSIAYRRQLPFVQRVAPGSPAAQAGVKADDLIVSANGTAIPHARAFNELCERLRPGDELSLVIKRGEQLVSIRFTLVEPPK
jgi:serine protease Do